MPARGYRDFCRDPCPDGTPSHLVSVWPLDFLQSSLIDAADLRICKPMPPSATYIRQKQKQVAVTGNKQL